MINVESITDLDSKRVTFQEEFFLDAYQDAKEIIKRNNAETGYLSDEYFEPRKEVWAELNAQDKFRVFTMRTMNNELVGYAGFYVTEHVLYPGKFMAQQDLLFVDKEYRGLKAFRFLKWVDEFLEEMGFDLIARTVSMKNPGFADVLSRMGYKLLEKNYVKELG